MKEKTNATNGKIYVTDSAKAATLGYPVERQYSNVENRKMRLAKYAKRLEMLLRGSMTKG